MTPLYIFLGAEGSGRREVLLDLIEMGLPEHTGTLALYLSEDEHPSPLDEELYAIPHSAILNYRLEEAFEINAEDRPPDTSTVFLLTDGRANPVDQIEALKYWMQSSELALVRIITILDCTLGQAHNALFAWFEACVHFSDAVLLNKRTDKTEKWVKTFRSHFHKHCYPCEFQLVKKGKAANPATALDDQTRRLTLIFDNLADSCASPNIFEDTAADWELKDEENTEEFDPEIRPDPYFKRLPSGLRAKPIPDIAQYL